MFCFLWAAAALAAVSAVLTDANPVFSRSPARGMGKPFWFGECANDEDPYSMFTNHFSVKAPNTQTFLQTEMKRIYSNSSITVTTSSSFNILAYASQSEDPILMKELEMDTLKKLVYIPPASRRYGSGVVAESVEFGGWTVGWRDHELQVVVASWAEGFQRIVQWHIISEKASTAQDLFRAVSVYATKTENAILVFDQGYWRPDYKLWQDVQQADWKDVILADEFKDRLQKDYRSFYKSEKVYKDLQVPWKRGLIFLGPPGNGKTISLKAIMHESKVPVLYVKSLHSDEASIKMVFDRARSEAPCLLVLEDLDSLINDMNRSFFLNEVDGIEGNDGLLLIGTTNHFDRLDPALSSRPSRFDRKYSFPNPSKDERRQYAEYWQGKLASNKDIEFPDELLDQFAEKTDKFSFAYMKEVFISSLLTLAGLDDPSKAPSFQSVVLDQIKHLRQQLDDDQRAFQASEIETGLYGGPRASRRISSMGGGMGGGMPYQEEPVLRVMSDMDRQEGLPQFVKSAGDVAEDEAAEAPQLVLQTN